MKIKSRLTIAEKITKLEAEKTKLLEAREKEILKIIKSTGSLSVDDILLTGALLFLKDEKNKSHQIADEFRKYANQRITKAQDAKSK